MSTQAQATESIYERFASLWNIADGVYTFDGENFSEPASGPWLRVSVRHSVSGQATLGQVGNRRFERAGAVLTNIFVPANTGRALADTLAGLVRTIFEGVSFGEVYFFESDCRETGIDGLWYGVVVESKFFYNETK